MFDLFAYTHLLAVAGSRAHGLSGPDSDVDLKGVCVPPRRSFFGIAPPFAQVDDSDQMAVFAPCLTPEEADVVSRTKLEGSVYGLQKLARLALDSNPNILEGLFCRDEEVRHLTPVGESLREGAHRFLSRRARHAFGGYAAAQLKRIRNHRQWLMHPPTEAPTRADFGRQYT